MFGSWPIFGKIALRAFSTAALVGFRVAGAAIAFLILQGATGRVMITHKSDYARFALYSLLGVVLNQLLFVKGLEMTTVVNATLLGTTIPIFALIVGVILGLDRLTYTKVLGVVLAAAGVIYLIDPARADFSGSTTIGNLLIIANSICYAAYIAISKDMVKRYGALTVITWMFVFGSVITTPLGFYFVSGPGLEAPTNAVWLAVLYIILIPTVGAYYLNAWALARVEPSTVAVYIYLQPLIAAALAPFILGEQWNSRTWVAMVLIFAGVVVVTRRDRSRAIEEVSEHPDAVSH
jgi:drug/metabolite transporter (DMT)-like permease